MAIKFEKIEAGQTLYDCHRYRMGNTTMTRMGTWEVEIIEVDRDNRRALVRWNGNNPEWWHPYRLERLRRKPYKPRVKGAPGR